MMELHNTAQSNPAKDIKTVAYVIDHAGADFTLQDIVLDGPQGNEYLIEMKYSGICHTDLICQQGSAPSLKFPAILGHEGAGYIRAIGDGVKRTDIKVGDFVLLSFNFCGECKRCRRNQPSTCLDGGKLHIGAVRANGGPPPARLKSGQNVQSSFFGQSSFAAMSVVDATCVAMRYPYDPEEAAMFAACGCGFQTGAGTVLNVLKPQQDDSIAIFGLGGVGLTALMAAKYLNLHQIIAVDITSERLDLAKELGATHTLNSKDVEDMAATLREISGGGVDFAIDCVGNASIIETMIACLAKRGQAASVGVMPPGSKIDIDALSFLFQNKRFLGILEGSSEPAKLVDMQRSGYLPLEKLCKTYPYEDMQKALLDMKAGKVIKPVLKWS